MILVGKSKKRKDVTNIAIATSIGIVIGFAGGVLLAPKTGKEIRSNLLDKAKNRFAKEEEEGFFVISKKF